MELFPLRRADEASGIVVVIDVIRAFTTAAVAFAAGADRILLEQERSAILDRLIAGLPSSLPTWPRRPASFKLDRRI